MVDKKANADEQLKRMKDLMNYGINESKRPEYSSVEYSKVAADGKLYGIVREGSNYYIKVAKNANGSLIAENFEYIGGFRNRKDNRFDGFASAQRFLCEKLQCINESFDDEQKRVIAESWDLDEKKEVIEEGTRKMRGEIERQRQIMRNTQYINEGKSCKGGNCCDMKGGCGEVETTKCEEVKSGNPAAPYVVVPGDDTKDNEKANTKKEFKPVKGDNADKKLKESTETPLTSRENPDYIDKSHGTEIGDNAPFVKKVEDKAENAVAEADGGEAETPKDLNNVNEGASMHDSDNQDTPAVGVGEKGDAAPFDEKADINEDIDDLDDTLDDEDGLEDGVDADDVEIEDEVTDDDGDDEFEFEIDSEEDGNEDRLDALEAKLDQILDALNDMKYDDEPLYGDDEDVADDADDEDDEYEVVESKSYKRMMKRMNEENDFGKHPAFQKKVMTTPPANMPDGEGQYDMNDESAESERPYATKKGSNAPFEVTPEQIENAITESVINFIKKKLG
jgi:hypothetical protein